MTNTTLKNIIYRLKRDKDNYCWNWTGATNATGYPQMGYKGKIVKVQRLFMHFTKGFDLQSKMWVRRYCENKLCCNPAHLYLCMKKHKGERKNVNQFTKKILTSIKRG